MKGRRLIAVLLVFILLSLGMPCRLPAHGQGEEGDRHHGNTTESHGHEDAQLAPPIIGGRDWVAEKTGQFIPLDLTFADEEGKPATLGDIIDRPTLLLPIYYYCPSACSRNLANLAVTLGRLTAVPGRDFRVISFSFNEKETADDARRAKVNYLKLAGKDFPEKEWRFLTGEKDAVVALTAAIGYRFEKSGDGTYVHPSAVVAIAGDGKIIRYVYGDFIPGDIDQAVADAAKGTPSFSVRRFLGMCFNTDPAAAGNGMFQKIKVGMLAVFVLAIAAFLFFLQRRSRRAEEKKASQE